MRNTSQVRCCKLRLSEADLPELATDQCAISVKDLFTEMAQLDNADDN